MERSSQLLNVSILVRFESFVILELMHAAVYSLDSIDREELYNICLVLLHSHGE